MRFRAAVVGHTSNSSTAVWSGLEAELALGRSGVIQRRARQEGEEDEEAAEVMRELKCARLKTGTMITTVGTRPKVPCPVTFIKVVWDEPMEKSPPRRRTQLSGAQRSLTQCSAAVVQTRRSPQTCLRPQQNVLFPPIKPLINLLRPLYHQIPKSRRIKLLNF